MIKLTQFRKFQAPVVVLIGRILVCFFLSGWTKFKKSSECGVDIGHLYRRCIKPCFQGSMVEEVFQGSMVEEVVLQSIPK